MTTPYLTSGPLSHLQDCLGRRSALMPCPYLVSDCAPVELVSVLMALSTALRSTPLLDLSLSGPPHDSIILGPLDPAPLGLALLNPQNLAVTHLGPGLILMVLQLFILDYLATLANLQLTVLPSEVHCCHLVVLLDLAVVVSAIVHAAELAAVYAAAVVRISSLTLSSSLPLKKLSPSAQLPSSALLPSSVRCRTCRRPRCRTCPRHSR